MNNVRCCYIVLMLMKKVLEPPSQWRVATVGEEEEDGTYHYSFSAFRSFSKDESKIQTHIV